MKEPKIYSGIDIIKVVMAFFIVFMHTYCYDFGTYGWYIKNAVSTIGVPFFFITSGYFCSKGIAQKGKKYLIQYLRRLIIMYLLWTIVTIPVEWYNISLAHAEFPITYKLIYVIRSVLFSGSVGVYWYLLSLIYVCIIIYLYYRFPFIKKYIYLVAIVGFLIGVVYNAGFLDEKLLGNIIHVIFGSERNFINVGLFYMCIGEYFSNHNISFSSSKLILSLAVLLVLKGFELSFIKVRLLQAPAALILFLLGMNWNIQISKQLSVKARKFSTCMYLTHFPFILVFDYYLQNSTLVDFSCTTLFSIVCFIIIQLLPRRFSNMFLGN